MTRGLFRERGGEMNAFQYAVSFRIWHPRIDPREITARLSLQPDVSWAEGDPRKTLKGTLLGGKREESYWSYKVTHGPDTGLAECLETFTRSIEPYDQYLKEIRSGGGRIEYFIGWFSGFNSGELLSHRLLSKLSALEIDLAFDIYGATRDEGVDDSV
jgi:hypothetical protein